MTAHLPKHLQGSQYQKQLQSHQSENIRINLADVMFVMFVPFV
jgi:hypothetical protein